MVLFLFWVDGQWKPGTNPLISPGWPLATTGIISPCLEETRLHFSFLVGWLPRSFLQDEHDRCLFIYYWKMVDDDDTFTLTLMGCVFLFGWMDNGNLEFLSLFPLDGPLATTGNHSLAYRIYLSPLMHICIASLLGKLLNPFSRFPARHLATFFLRLNRSCVYLYA